MSRTWAVAIVEADGRFYNGRLYHDGPRNGPRRIVAATAEEARDLALKAGPPSSRRAHTVLVIETTGPLHRWRIKPTAPEYGPEEVMA